MTDELFRGLLDGFQAKFRAWQESERKTASDFDLLDTLQISGDELKHSRMLAWLLDNRIERAATHAQGNLGFRLFLEELAFDTSYARGPYWVTREVRGDESRVDVEIAASSQFVIHIENKIYSPEGWNQTGREWNALLLRAKELCVKPERVHGIFLTLAGIQPTNRKFIPISWSRIADILDRFAIRAKAPEVQVIAAHYARALRRMTVRRIELYEDEDETDNDA